MAENTDLVIEEQDGCKTFEKWDEPLSETRQIFDFVKSKSNEMYRILQQDFQLLENKRKSIEKMTKKIENVHFADVVRLNVGGVAFETGLQTLRKHPNSLFAKMFSGTVALKNDCSKPYFIDRDGTHFR